MDSDLVWLIAGIGLLLVEVFTLTVVLGLLGVAALVAAAIAFLGVGAIGQAVAFAGASTALLLFAREPVQKMINKTSGSNLDPAALSGSAAVVVQRVSDDSGQVRLSGELWRARPYAGVGPIDVGRSVVVAEVEGATLLVYPPELD